jgi:hypothetical protein
MGRCVRLSWFAAVDCEGQCAASYDIRPSTRGPNDSAEDQPLGAAIERMLWPLGFHLEVHDEVVVIAKAP